MSRWPRLRALERTTLLPGLLPRFRG